MAHQGSVSTTNTPPCARFCAASRPFAPSHSSQPQCTDHQSLPANHMTYNRSASPFGTHVTMLQAVLPRTRHSSLATRHYQINRQPRRLEITVSRRKQTTDALINRQLFGTYQNGLFAPSRRICAHENYPRIVFAAGSQVAIVFLKYA